MKRVIIVLSLLSIVLTMLTLLNYEIDILGKKIQDVKDENSKLEHDLSFHLAELEYKTSPKNIEKLTNKFLDTEKADLVKLSNFLELLEYLELEN